MCTFDFSEISDVSKISEFVEFRKLYFAIYLYAMSQTYFVVGERPKLS